MELIIETNSKRKFFLHQNFLKASDERFSGYASCGAGCGNDLVEFVITNKQTGVTVRENFKMSDVYEQWAEKVCNDSFKSETNKEANTLNEKAPD